MGNSVPLVGGLELCKGREIKQNQSINQANKKASKQEGTCVLSKQQEGMCVFSKKARGHVCICFSLLLIVDLISYLKS